MDIFNNPHAKNGEVKLTKAYKRRRTISRLFIALFSVAIVVSFAYIVTTITTNPIRTNDGTIYTTQKELYEPGDEVVAIENNHFVNKLLYRLVPVEPTFGSIVAGPYGKITSLADEKYKITDAGKEAYVTIREDFELDYLTNAYAVEMPNGYTHIFLERDIVGLYK